MNTKTTPTLTYNPLTPDRWKDVEGLFGPKGGCAGCWCMYWKQKQSEYDAKRGDENKKLFRKLVMSGEEMGLLAYQDGEAVGWCAVAPRDEYSRLARSRVLKPVDDKEVWSIVCFFIRGPHRKKGVSSGLLKAAVEFAADAGAKIVEGYPIEPKTESYPPVYAWTGFAGAFKKTGFKEVQRRSPTRPIMRIEI